MKTTVNTAFLVNRPKPDAIDVEQLLNELEQQFPNIKFTDSADEYNRLVHRTGMLQQVDIILETQIRDAIESLICDDDHLFPNTELLDTFIKVWSDQVGPLGRAHARDMLSTAEIYRGRCEFGARELARRGRTGDPEQFADELLDNAIEPGDFWGFDWDDRFVVVEVI